MRGTGRENFSSRATNEKSGAILACDRDGERLNTLRQNLDRLGVTIATVAKVDWTKASGEKPKEQFDRILLDAPCSNTGVMRRRVDVRWRLQPDDFARMQERQLAIARKVIESLKPGGVLVYSTCSIEPEENEEVVAQLVNEFTDLQLLEQKVRHSVSGRIRRCVRGKAQRIREAEAVCIRQRRWNHYALMHDPRFDKLAKVLVEYSTRLEARTKLS